jgi:hypothetical protein
VKTLSVVALVLSLLQIASGQIRGLGFVQGTVVDEKGTPLADVVYVANLPRVGDRLNGVSNQKGEWKVIGMAHGEWDIVFEKPGYLRNSAKILLEPELARIRPITITLKPGATNR